MPNAIPSSLTSSLNSSLSGSIRDRWRVSGKPPTLWWVLIVADGPYSRIHYDIREINHKHVQKYATRVRLYDIHERYIYTLYEMDSMTSGYKVPCNKNSALGVIFSARAWNSSINSLPIVFLLSSGSVTPASWERNFCDASMTVKLIPRESRRRWVTCTGIYVYLCICQD